eukprot:TRINITY_DN160_c0_g1_i1.p1 TRINITY_DN160_c0_g1~~TRINITY_DN160_c0_g1_i1.p1  ORF type:complete len:323 (-),score=69.27 TRINITY_DN160_c0_g1_i1:33-974(-)
MKLFLNIIGVFEASLLLYLGSKNNSLSPFLVVLFVTIYIFTKDLSIKPLFNKIIDVIKTRQRKRITKNQLDCEKLPNHIGIIMDGNGRWAKKQGLPRVEGHRKGADVVKSLIEHVTKLKISMITFYCFSQENWKRPADEVNYLMNLLKDFLKNQKQYIENNDGVFKSIGNIESFDKELQELIRDAEESTKDHKGTTFVFALSYSGHNDIVNSIHQCIKKESEKICNCDNNVELFKDRLIKSLNEEKITENMSTPPCDLIIRTSGEYRLSNFLTWQSTYSELVFIDRYWPEFDGLALNHCLEEYFRRSRRFGAL